MGRGGGWWGARGGLRRGEVGRGEGGGQRGRAGVGVVEEWG